MFFNFPLSIFILAVGILYHKKRGGQPLFLITVEFLYKYVCIRFVVYHILLDTRSNHLICHRETCNDYAASHLTDCAMLDYAFSSKNLPHNERRFNSSLLPLNSTIIYFYPNIIKKI